MKKVCLLGASFTTGNMGVSALTHSLIDIITYVDPQAEIYLLSPHREPARYDIRLYDRTTCVKLVNFRYSPRSSLKDSIYWLFLASLIYRIIPISFLRASILRFFPALDLLTDSQWVGDIRGGDSSSDIYGLPRFLLGSLPLLVIILLGKKITLLPQTFGPYNYRIARVIARTVLNHSSFIFSRDTDSLHVLSHLSKDEAYAKKATLVPDVAFYMRAKKPEELRFVGTHVDVENIQSIGINVSGLLYIGGYTRNNMFNLQFDYSDFVKTLVVELVKKFSMPVVLIPHTYSSAGDKRNVEDDFEACNDTFNRLPGDVKRKVHVLDKGYTEQELKWIIGKNDFFVGSRMHSCIAAVSQCVPTVALAYSGKFSGVFNNVGLADLVIDGRERTADEAIGRIVSAYRRRASIRKNIEIKMPSVQFEIVKCFRTLH